MDLRRGANGSVTATAAPALGLRGISKQFGNVAALNSADLIVRAGTVHALLGENGAGKTTLMRVAFGLVQPDAGTVERSGRTVQFRAPSNAIAAGIGMVHQHFSLVPEMTVAENVALGGRGRLNLRVAAERVREIGAASGLTLDPLARVGDLPVGAQQRVEIVKAFARDATLLILDEPTAVLTPGEAGELIERLRAFARAGNAVVLITHKIREAIAAADDITVLRQGRTALATSASSTTESVLVQAMVGAAPLATRHPAAVPSTQVVIRVDHVTARDSRGVVRLRAASAAAHAGEILGIAGVEGNGQRELIRVMAGRLVPSGGDVVLPTAVGFVPEDRHRDALVLDFNLIENVALAGASRRRGAMRWDDFEHATRALLSEFEVAASGPFAIARSLSGGNQQRFVLGRELRGAPPALIVESPTRGLDVRAAVTVHARLRAAADAGTAVVVYSSDLEELLALSDRVLVCFAGQVSEVAREAHAIGRALTGARE